MAKVNIPDLSQVLATLRQDPQTQAEIIARYKANGGTMTAWSSAEQLLMADAITHAEDALEMGTRRNRDELRARLRDVRRLLEGAAEVRQSRRRKAA